MAECFSRFFTKNGNYRGHVEIREEAHLARPGLPSSTPISVKLRTRGTIMLRDYVPTYIT